MHDVAALCGVTVDSVKRWRSGVRGGGGPPVPAFDSEGSACWLRATIVPWLVEAGHVTPDVADSEPAGLSTPKWWDR